MNKCFAASRSAIPAAAGIAATLSSALPISQLHAPLGAPHRATGEYELCARNAQGEFVRDADDARQIEFGAVRRQISHDAAEGAAWKLYHPGLEDTLSRFCTVFHGEIVGAVSKRSMKLVDETEADFRRSRTKFIYPAEERLGDASLSGFLGRS